MRNRMLCRNCSSEIPNSKTFCSVKCSRTYWNRTNNATQNKILGARRTRIKEEKIAVIKDSVIQSYQVGGKKMAAIAEEHSVSYTMINQIIKKYSTVLPKKRYTTSEFIDTNPNLNEQYLQNHIANNSTCKTISDLVGVSPNTIAVYARKWNIQWPSNRPSELEAHISNWLAGKIDIEKNKRNLNGKEIDIFIPAKNLGIEINGNYWHSEIFRDKWYHYNKTILATEIGIELLQFFEDEVIEKEDIVKSMISAKLGMNKTIFARKCILKEVNNSTKNEFLIENHLKGKCPSSHNLGLFHDEELVALMTFGRSRFSKITEWELLRYVSKVYVNVVGGASKLLRHFTRTHTGSIISYADLRYSSGNLYKNIGFSEIGSSNPNYFYMMNSNCSTRLSRTNFQKHKLKTFEHYSDDLTEVEIMKLNGYIRIWDCGTKSFIYE